MLHPTLDPCGPEEVYSIFLEKERALLTIIHSKSSGVRVKPRNCILHFFQEATEMIYFDLKSYAEY